jgi:hypothetical protein
MDSRRGWPAQQWMEWQNQAKSFQGIAAYDWTFDMPMNHAWIAQIVLKRDSSVVDEHVECVHPVSRAPDLRIVGYVQRNRLHALIADWQ